MNYTDLQTEVAAYLHRTDLTSYIPGFITKAENKINAKMRCPDQYVLSTVSTTTNSRFAALPTGLTELKKLWYTDETVADALQYLTPEQMSTYQVTFTGKPGFYTVTDQIEFEQPASSVYSINIRYLAKLNIANDSTNWLLTNHEDCYLFGALAEAGPFIGTQRYIEYKNLFKEACDSAMEHIKKLQSKSNTVMIPDYPSQYNRFNIESGYGY